MDNLLKNIPLYTTLQIMGILNVTEDSFSDGGKFYETEAAIKQAKQMIADGADIIDIGAESTRPGSEGIPKEIQWQRIEPVLKEIKHSYPDILISIDTQDSFVAAKALEYGADIINDISALRNDKEMVNVLKSFPRAKLIIMHIQGVPKTMQDNPFYDDVVAEVSAFLKERAEYAIENGIDKSRITIDPGIGFGKNLKHNLTLLASLHKLEQIGFPLLLGASRKRFINAISPSEVQRRLGGSLATTLLAILAKASIIRVHDVFEHRQFLDTLQAVSNIGG